jgi:predicted negative regulator of RcsB-dependent stress response
MDILDEAKVEVKREKFTYICKKYGQYLMYVIFVSVVCSILYFWWKNHQKKILLEEASEYNDALSMDKDKMIVQLEGLKKKKTIYASLSKLQLAAIYIEENNFNKAIHNYEQLIKKDNIEPLYLDYAKLMIIKTKLATSQINEDAAIKLLVEYLKDAMYFQNIARLINASLLINKGNSKDGIAELNFIITSPKVPSTFMSLAKILEKSTKKG